MCVSSATFAALTVGLPALAQTTTTAPATSSCYTSKNSTYGYNAPLGNICLPDLINRIVNQVLPIVGALFLVMFLWGGVMWMTAGGEKGKLHKAQQTLMNAVIGVAVVIGAYFIVGAIIGLFGAASKG